MPDRPRRPGISIARAMVSCGLRPRHTATATVACVAGGISRKIRRLNVQGCRSAARGAHHC